MSEEVVVVVVVAVGGGDGSSDSGGGRGKWHKILGVMVMIQMVAAVVKFSK